ncbi:MAG: ATP phosphoribosyltransferase regulatory subunit [Rhodocyclaceae bacterium]
MALPRWALPEHFEDVLPVEAAALETLRRRVLDEFRVNGYQLVVPPMVEHFDSLISGAGRDMAASTFTLIDQLSGRTLGLRADITPQVTRIDAHLLNRQGVTRLCYCGSVVQTVPRALNSAREQVQVGAELFGHGGIEADEEILRLLTRVLDLAGIATRRVDLGHLGLFRALSAYAGLDQQGEEALFAILQTKDVPALRDFTANLSAEPRAALMALPNLYGDANVLIRAMNELPDIPGVRTALEELLHLARRLADQPLSFDLADLRGYHYHTGLVFAAYCGSLSAAVALGGRYNNVGQSFGRARPATGFSLDLRALAATVGTATQQGAILAPLAGDENLGEVVAALRARGEIVMLELPGHDGAWQEAGCDRRLIMQNGAWHVVPL